MTSDPTPSSRLSALRRRVGEIRRSRLVATRTVHDVTPPQPSAFASFGTNSWIVPPARVVTPEAISIGNDVTILEHSWISVVAAVEGVQPSLTIGNRCYISRFLHIACVGEMFIGDDCLIAERILIGDSHHDYVDPTMAVMDQPMAYPRPVRIERGTFLGTGCAVFPGVTIGEYSIIGAGAMVTSDVPPRSIVLGNPARVVSSYDEALGQWVKTP